MEARLKCDLISYFYWSSVASQLGKALGKLGTISFRLVQRRRKEGHREAILNFFCHGVSVVIATE